jgi:hypothetical protein
MNSNLEPLSYKRTDMKIIKEQFHVGSRILTRDFKFSLWWRFMSWSSVMLALQKFDALIISLCRVMIQKAVTRPCITRIWKERNSNPD